MEFYHPWQVYKRLGVSADALYKWIKEGTIPSIKVKGYQFPKLSKAYVDNLTKEEIDRIKKDSLLWSADTLTITEVARRCGVAHISLKWHIDKGRFPAPTNKRRGFYVYTQEEANKIIEDYKKIRRAW